MATRYESVQGVRNLYRDHKRTGSPFVIRWKQEGKVREKVLGTMSRKDAITRRDQFFAVPLPVAPKGAPPRCEEAFEKWFDARTSAIHKRQLSASTAKRYRGLWKNHAKSVLGRKRVRDVTVDDIALVFTRMQEKGLDPNNAYVMLASFFRAMTQVPYGYRPDNPVQQLGELKPPAPKSDAVPEDAVLTREELEAVILAVPSKAAIDKQVRRTLIRLGYLTGLRLSEILALSWEQVDLDEGEIHVERQLTIDYKVGDPETWFKAVKGEKTKVGNTARIVFLDDEAEALLREHRQWVFSVGLYRGTDSLLFPTKNLTPINQSGASEMFTTAVERSGETRYPWTFHCLRHSFASIEFAQGNTISGVAQLLGHSSDVTQKRYVHLVDRSAQREAFKARRRAAAL